MQSDVDIKVDMKVYDVICDVAKLHSNFELSYEM